MRKKAVIYEDEFSINKKKSIRKSIDKNNIKNISFFYIFLTIIFIILIINLYYTIKLYKYEKQKDIEFLKNENIVNGNFDKYKSKEKKRTR